MPQHPLGVGVVALAGEDEDALGQVVGGVAINMMDDLPRLQGAAQHVLGHPAVDQFHPARFAVEHLTVFLAPTHGTSWLCENTKMWAHIFTQLYSHAPC